MVRLREGGEFGIPAPPIGGTLSVAATAIFLLLLLPLAGLGAATDGPADPDTALHLSLWTTLGGSLAGTAIYLGGWACPVHVTEYEHGRSSEVDPGCYWGTRISGWGLVGAGLVFGPSIGRLYAGDTARGLLLSGLRLLVAGVGALTMVFAFDAGVGLMGGDDNCVDGCCENDHMECPDSGSSNDFEMLMTISVVHLLALQALVVADIATTRKAARRANERRRQRAVEVSLAPAAFPGAGGDVLYGLTIDGSF